MKLVLAYAALAAGVTVATLGQPAWWTLTGLAVAAGGVTVWARRPERERLYPLVGALALVAVVAGARAVAG